jgi:hypothetical protein
MVGSGQRQRLLLQTPKFFTAQLVFCLHGDDIGSGLSALNDYKHSQNRNNAT